MKLFVVFFLAALVALSSGEKDYGLENLDFQEVLNNEDERLRYYNCVMDKKPCGSLQSFKDNLGEILKTECAECSPRVKEGYTRAYDLVANNYPEVFNEIMNKYARSHKSE